MEYRVFAPNGRESKVTAGSLDEAISKSGFVQVAKVIAPANLTVWLGLKLSKSAIRKALKGWGSSGDTEMSQKDAIDLCFERILDRESEIKIFRPNSESVFYLDGQARSITRCNRYTGDVEEVFVFEVKEKGHGLDNGRADSDDT